MEVSKVVDGLFLMLIFVALELTTPPLDGMILPGVTRDSVIQLARGHASKKQVLKGLPEKFEINERPVTMGEVKTAAENGSLVELFGAGMLPFRKENP